MAFDACMMRAVLHEIACGFFEGKVERVLAPQKDEVDLVLHAKGASSRLVFNVGATGARLGLSDIAKENPKTPTMLCMLLRKHLIGARLTDISQVGFDRIAIFTFLSHDDMGFTTERKLVTEIMGKYANLILLDGEDRIISAVKLIDFSDSTVRQILPGMKYKLPDDQGRRAPTDADSAFFFERMACFPPERTVEKFITSTYAGIATSIAHELCYRATGGIDTPLVNTDKDRLYEVFRDFSVLLAEHRYTPTLLLDTEGHPIEYSFMPITYRQNGCEARTFDSFRELFDAYFAERDRIERIRNRAHDVLTLLNNAENRTRKKLVLQRQALLDSERAEEYKRAGELITANLYQIKRGMTELDAIDYYDPECRSVKITLDERINPSQNAQRYYKLYNKAKTAKAVLTERIAEWERELLYLESVRDFLSRAQTENDLFELREELYRAGYGSRMKGYRPGKPLKQKPLELKTTGGYRLLVGKNNTQNDLVTFKLSSKGDLWFHVKDLPGSHVVLLCDGEEPSEADYTEAAAVAAYYSKATADRVAVDYTRVKNIKKPQGAPPGFVTYKTNFTAYVAPMADPLNKK